jgi:hypothetical protein
MLVAVGVGVTFAVVLVALTSLPLETRSQTGVLELAGACPPYCPADPSREAWSLPSGTTIHVNWQEEHQQVTDFMATTSSGAIVCRGIDSDGSCSFVSEGGQYTFAILPLTLPIGAAQPTSYTLTYALSYLQPIL